MKVKIEVTEDDIQKGHKGTARFCPIAFAVKRVLKPKYHADVWVTPFSVTGVSDYRELPKKAMRFIDQFDNRLPVKPFSFRIDIDEDKLQG